MGLPTFSTVQKIPSGVHWFCPRHGDDDNEDYEEELPESHAVDNTDSALQKRKRIDESKERAKLVFDTFLILAYDGEDIAEQRDWFKNALDGQLTECDTCVRHYHKGKKRMIDKLLA